MLNLTFFEKAVLTLMLAETLIAFAMLIVSVTGN